MQYSSNSKQSINKKTFIKTGVSLLLIILLFSANSCHTFSPLASSKFTYNNYVLDTTSINFKPVYKKDYEIVQSNVIGEDKGLKLVPLIPFLPDLVPGILWTDHPSLIQAEQNALRGTNGDFLVNKKIEKSKTGFLIFYITKITVSGEVAKLVE